MQHVLSGRCYTNAPSRMCVTAALERPVPGLDHKALALRAVEIANTVRLELIGSVTAAKAVEAGRDIRLLRT